MALKLNINKASGADRVTLSPAPLKIVLSKEQPAANMELVVTASEDFKQRPGPNKTVTFRFLNDESRNLFDTPAKPEPFVLKPGESLSLKLKNSLGISKRPASGSSSQQFERTAAGAIDKRFTREISFEFVEPAKADDPDDSDVHVEC